MAALPPAISRDRTRHAPRSAPGFRAANVRRFSHKSIRARRTTNLHPRCALRFSRSRWRVLCKSGDPFLLLMPANRSSACVCRVLAAFMTSVTSNACTNSRWGPRVGVSWTRYARRLPRSATMMSEVAVIPSQRGRHSCARARARAIPAERFRRLFPAHPERCSPRAPSTPPRSIASD